MAATNISGGSHFPDGDYSVPHRSPPPIPPTSPRLPSSPPHFNDLSSPRQRHHQPQQPHADDAASVSTSEHRRRPSFSFLRRTPSGRHQKDSSVEAAPPLPTTRIAQVAQAQQHQQAQPQHAEHSRSNSSSARKPSGEGRMLRKKSKHLQEQERQARETERMNRPAPRLPQLPGDFVGDAHPDSNLTTTTSNTSNPAYNSDGVPRPDSVAIFNSQSHYHANDAPPVPRGNTNFSRPAHAMPASSSSSSPAYAVRAGSAYSGSSPNVIKVNGNREYVPEPTERAESMTNRGRYSYASSMAPVNVNSPRRVRRRKDPTPFK